MGTLPEPLRRAILDVFLEDSDVINGIDGILNELLFEGRNLTAEEEVIKEILSKLWSLLRNPLKHEDWGYRALLDVGFSQDEAVELSSLKDSFTSNEMRYLEEGDRREFLKRIGEGIYLLRPRPFLAKRILYLEVYPENTSNILDRLDALGHSVNSPLLSSSINNTWRRYVLNTLTYPSGRPRTEMGLFNNNIRVEDIKGERGLIFSSFDNVLINPQWIGKTLSINTPSFFPVVRYGTSEHGTFHSSLLSNRAGLFCGTFYYYEPYSTIYLEAFKILLTPNKFCATVYLIGMDRTIELMENYLDEFGDIVFNNVILNNNNNNNNGGEEEMSDVTEEYAATYSKVGPPRNYDLNYKDWKDVFSDMMNGTFNFLQHNKLLYPMEDRFDQIICSEASKKEGGREEGRFDIIVLTTMTGRTRVVTEILDVRSRRTSYDSLIKNSTL